MAKSKNDELKGAEAIGQIRSLPEVQALPEIVEEKFPVLDNPEEFRMAIGQAQMDGHDYVEVTERLFKYLVKNNETNYLTYGDPGIKVFKQGTREGIESLEGMSAIDHHEHVTKKNRAARGMA